MILALLCAILLCIGVSASEIKSCQAQVTVAEDGTVTVQLDAVITFDSAVNELIIPLGSGAYNVILSGQSSKTTQINGVDCVVLSNTAGFSGTQQISCSYSLPCAITEVDSGQRFTLKLPEGGWEYGIADYRLTVSFPVEVTALPDWSSGYYADVLDNYLHIQVSGNTVSAASISPLHDRETVKMVLDFPKDSFDPQYQAGQSALTDKLLFCLLFAAALAYWFFRLREGRVKASPRRSLGMEATAGEVPCQLFGEQPDIAAVLVHWANLGYLIIRRSGSGRITLCKQMEMGNERKPAERKLFYAIFRKGNLCDVQSQRFRLVSKASGRSIRSAWLRRIYRTDCGSPRLLRLMALCANFFICLLAADNLLPANGSRWVLLPLLLLCSTGLCWCIHRAVTAPFRRHFFRWALPGAAALLLLLLLGQKGDCSIWMGLNLALQLFCSIVTIFGGRRTAAGMECQRELLGLRRFLRHPDQKALERMMRQDSQYFYRILPFAEVMGLGQSFARHFTRVEPCEWLIDARQTPATAEGFWLLYTQVLTQLRDDSLPRPAGRRPRQPIHR